MTLAHPPRGIPPGAPTLALRAADLGARIARWGRRLGLEPLDIWFAGLRAAALVAGSLWWVLTPETTRGPLLGVLLTSLAFSVGLYALNARRPGRLATLYRIALVVDLVLIYVLVRATGGFASDLYLAFILLIALHAFYFGLATGFGAGVAAAALYALAGRWPPPIPGFLLREAFLLLVGLCMGVVAEQARRRRQVLEQHHEQLLRSDRLATVGELAASLAHELRNPLAGIAGALRVLAERLPADDGSQELLADLQAQIARMNKTLTDLLQHARPPEPQRIEVDLNALLEQSLRFLPRGRVEVIRDYDESLPPVRVDPSLLHQAFLNVLVNAHQAMPQGGRLTVRTRRGAPGSHGVEVQIQDTGVGIHPEHLPRIFQPFFTTKSQGTGLGLAIAARAVEQHGGRISVESVPGRGSTFTITFPADATREGLGSGVYAMQGAGR